MGVTFSQADWRRAQAAWEAGEFDRAWSPFRELAGRAGFIYPPAGTRWDSWEDDQPSQRAIIWRAIEETPDLLRRCIARARSWSDVVRELTSERDAWRARLASQASEEPDPISRREAPELLCDVMRRAAVR